MKTAITVEQSRKQLVLTPENDFDKEVIDIFKQLKNDNVSIVSGEFYPCQGGYSRFSPQAYEKEDSLIFVFNKAEEKVEQ